MSNTAPSIYLITLSTFAFIISLITSIYHIVNRPRTTILERLHSSYQSKRLVEEDVLDRPFLERTIGTFARWLVTTISQVTPNKVRMAIDKKLEKAGNKRNLKSSDFLAIQGIFGLTVLIISSYFLVTAKVPPSRVFLLALTLTAIAVYLPWFMLAKAATTRQNEIKHYLPDMMDLLVISVEAGLAFDMALSKVIEKFHGSIAQEFRRVLREMQLGRPRKEALKDMAERVNVPELSTLVNAIIQSEQLGVGLSNVLRMQGDLIREKRQQTIEELAMKAPIKMLFPLVFFIFPSIFIVILGPAVLNIMKALGSMGGK